MQMQVLRNPQGYVHIFEAKNRSWNYTPLYQPVTVMRDTFVGLLAELGVERWAEMYDVLTIWTQNHEGKHILTWR
jgi:hypothetical protein